MGEVLWIIGAWLALGASVSVVYDAVVTRWPPTDPRDQWGEEWERWMP